MDSTKRPPAESTRQATASESVQRDPTLQLRATDVDKRERDVTARELALDSQMHGEDADARRNLDWWKGLSAAEKAQVSHALVYTDHHAAADALGADQYLLIAKLARLLDAHEITPETKPV